MKWLLATCALVSLNALAVEARLEIVSDEQRLTFSQSQLLSRRDLKTIAINDSDYKKRFTQFKAIPIPSLFKGIAIPDDAVVQFSSTDGFSATLEKTRLLSTDPKASTAFLAIEDPKSPWPHLTGKKRFSRAFLPGLEKPGGVHPSARRNGPTRLPPSRSCQTRVVCFQRFTLPPMPRRMFKTDSSRSRKIALRATR